MTAVVWGGWDDTVRDDPFPTFAAARRECPVQHVDLPDGHGAWLVLGHEVARLALADERLSKDMIAALDHDPDVVDEGLPGPEFAHHMLAMDAPDHGRLRSLVAEHDPCPVPVGQLDVLHRTATTRRGEGREGIVADGVVPGAPDDGGHDASAR